MLFQMMSDPSNSPPSTSQPSHKLRFECTKCGKCCQDPKTLVNLTFADIERLHRLLKLDVNGLLSILGFYVYETPPTEDQIKKMVIPPIQTEQGLAFLALKKNLDGRCVYLDDNNTCKIYDARPDICRTFPFHFNTVPHAGAKPHLSISMSYTTKAKEYCPGIGEKAPLINADDWLRIGSMTVNNILAEHVLIKKYHQAIKEGKLTPSARNYLLTVLELTKAMNAPEKKKKISYQVRLKEKLKEMEKQKQTPK